MNSPKVVGGIGEKKSNNGTQYYQQDRIYDGSGIAMCLPASLPTGSYYYAIEEKDESKYSINKRKKRKAKTDSQ